MIDLDGERISDGSLFFHRRVLPILGGAGCLAWFGGVIAAGAWPAVVGGVPLAIMGFAHLNRFHLPLREVRLGERGLVVAGRGSPVAVPYEAVATIRQDPRRNAAIIEVELDRATPVGRRFTFLPRQPNYGHFPYPREDRVVTLLRERVAAAREDGKKPSAPMGPTGRSVMAYEELDGPL